MDGVDAGAIDDLEAEVAQYVTGVAATLSEGGSPPTPKAIVSVARVAVGHASHAALTLIRPGRRPTTIASSDPVCLRVDALQYQAKDGPCLDAATGPSVIASGDVGADERWPTFGPRCVQMTDIRSMLSLRLPVGGGDHAALNLYAEERDAFSRDDVVTGSVLAPLAALVVEADLRRRDVTNLTAALETSRTIGTAVGILMANHRVTREDAFALLRRASMDLNEKLRDVAEDVQLTGALPDGPSGDSAASALPESRRSLPAEPSRRQKRP